MTRDAGPIALAERILMLLDRGAFTSTYKYAVLLGLLDACLENARPDGAAPDMITTRQLADRVFALYWPQVMPFEDTGETLTQMGGRKDQRSPLLEEVGAFREYAETALRTTSLARAMVADPSRYAHHRDKVESKLVEFPLPRLQRMGKERTSFLFSIGWDERVRGADVRAYQRGDATAFDNRILLLAGVGEQLLQLNGVLRPLIQGAWSSDVSRMNQLREGTLDRFLFGVDRSSLERVRDPLLELQGGRCFYCGARVAENAHVDHFIPWARYTTNAIENLVVADARCNLAKSDFLASADHIARWRRRAQDAAHDLRAISDDLQWESAGDRMTNVARGIYLRLPVSTPLWIKGSSFAPLVVDEIEAAIV